MKNIHLIPTSQPSRLFYGANAKKLMLSSTAVSFKIFERSPQHIYITNDKIIKEGDYFWKPDCNMIFKAEYTPHKGCQKVILTTDQSLDGIQSIDDEFLEWFVKNPSCEYVEVEREKSIGYTEDRARVFYGKLKIIIPQEESKPVWKQIIEDCGGEEAFMEAAGLKPEQETIEDGAEEYYNNNIFCDGITDFEHDIAIRCYIAGAKDQAERMYSEEDLLSAFKAGMMFIGEDKGSFREWFEQFKKK